MCKNKNMQNLRKIILIIRLRWPMQSLELHHLGKIQDIGY